MREGLGLGVGLGLGNQVAISTRGVIIWQGVENGHNTGFSQKKGFSESENADTGKTATYNDFLLGDIDINVAE